MRLLGGLLVVCAALAPVMAEPLEAGPQPVPPVTAGEPVLPQELDGRRAIRGCAVDETCAHPGEAMKEVDVELFPQPGHSPWVGERDLASSRLEPTPSRTVQRPSELRPDQPWLDQLEMPDLPVRWSQKLVDYLVFYKNDPRGRSIIKQWLIDQGRYRELIVSHLRKAKLPEDLLYVSMIESSYDPETLSSAGALGIWQFMPEGGKIYGLRQDRWVDERKDPLRSTIAQMDYFRDLYQRFGDWHIALASFNVGYGAMLRSIARYNTNDYYKLCEYENAVPWETCLYTPKVLATAIVGHNRALFGVDKLTVKGPEAFDEVAVPASVSLSLIARAAGATEAEIKRLNPHLRRGRTPPGEVGYVVRVPTGTKVATQRKLVELQSDWDGYDAYVVAHGERFEDIATTYGISTSALRKLNGVEHESEITGGTVLVVPRISADQRTKNQAKAKSKLLGSGIDQKEGEPLIVAVPDKDFTVAGKQRVFYRVVIGDSVTSISKAFGVSADQLRTWNGLDPEANLHPKMVLVAWVPPTFDADKARVALLDDTQLVVVTRGSNEHLDLAEARTGRVRLEYVSPGKEKLEDVARRYGMGSHDLARINRISYSTVLAKGDKIIVYQVTDPSRSQRAEEQWKKTPRGRRGKVKGDRARTTTSVAEDDDDDADDQQASNDDAEAKDDDDKPAAKKTASKDDDKPAKKTASKDDDKPAAKKKASKDDDRPAVKKAASKDDDKPVVKKAASKDDDKPAVKKAASKDDDKPAVKKAASKDDAEPAKSVRDGEAKPAAKKTASKDDDDRPARKQTEKKASQLKAEKDSEKQGRDHEGPVTRPTQAE